MDEFLLDCGIIGDCFMHTQYLDPVHNSYVTLDGFVEKVFYHFKSEIQRLKKIAALGLISVLKPIARHTKFDHQIGVLYLLERAEKSQQIPKGFFNAFQFAAAINHIGHLPFTVSSERALYLASCESVEVRQSIIKYVEPLDFIPRKNMQCSKKCFINEKRPTQMLEERLDTGKWWDIYKFLSATKALCKYENSLSLIHNLEAEVVHIILGEQCECYEKLNQLDRLDWALRDLTYAATSKISLNLSTMIDNFQADEWRFIDNVIEGYLEPYIYRSSDVEIKSALFEKALANCICKDAELWKQMLDPESLLSSDAGLQEYCREHEAFRGIFEVESEHFAKVWEIPLYIP